MSSRLVFAVLVGTLLIACDDPDAASVEVTQLTPTPFTGTLTGNDITIAEGTAMGIRIVVLDADRYILPEGTGWTVNGGAATLVKLDAPEAYVVGGAQEGSARLVSDEGLIIAVTVTPQPTF